MPIFFKSFVILLLIAASLASGAVRLASAEEGWTPVGSYGNFIRVYYKQIGDQLSFKFINRDRRHKAAVKYQLRCESRTRTGKWEKQASAFGAGIVLNKGGGTHALWGVPGAAEYRSVAVDIIDAHLERGENRPRRDSREVETH